MSGPTLLQPSNWPTPKGYANGLAASGETIWLGGQIGWDERGQLADGLTAQVEQALRNIVTVLAEAHAGPADIVRMTWYLCSIDEYKARLPEIGLAYRRVIGKHFPVMSVVEIVRLVEADARVEIEATAVRRPRAAP